MGVSAGDNRLEKSQAERIAKQVGDQIPNAALVKTDTGAVLYVPNEQSPQWLAALNSGNITVAPESKQVWVLDKDTHLNVPMAKICLPEHVGVIVTAAKDVAKRDFKHRLDATDFTHADRVVKDAHQQTAERSFL